jgi:hypothetical protein
MSSAPVRSAVTMAASSPSWAEGATCTSMRPPDLALTTSANLTAASWRGLPGAAPWPSVSFTAWAWRAERQARGGRAAGGEQGAKAEGLAGCMVLVSVRLCGG